MTDLNRPDRPSPAGELSVVFMGSPAFAVPSLTRLAERYNVKAVYTQPPRKSGRGLKLRPTAVGEAAEQLALPCFWPDTLKEADTQAQLAEIKADLFVVVAYGLLLPQAVLDIPVHGCVNGHASLLPRWRGAAPIQRAIEAGDSRTGVSTMLMEQGLDTGPVFDTSQTAITDDMTAGQLHDILAEQTADLLCVTLDKIQAGTAQPEAQPEEGVIYAHKISSADSQLHLDQPADILQRKINAYTPYPGAFVETRFGRLKLIQARPITAAGQALRPGQFCGLSDTGGLILTCGQNNALDVNMLQPAGKKAMTARAWLNGHALRPGQSLTDPDE